MNKQEKIIVFILAAAAAALFARSCVRGNERAAAQNAAAQSAKAAPAAESKAEPAVPPAAEKPAEKPVEKPRAVPEVLPVGAVLSNGCSRVTISSLGACVTCVELPAFNEKPGEAGPDNGPVRLDFSASPALVLDGVDGVDRFAQYELKECTATNAVFALPDGRVVRSISLDGDYGVMLEEKFSGVRGGANSISLGVLRREAAQDAAQLTFDSRPAGGSTIHYASDKTENQAAATLKLALGAGPSSGGCGCGCSAAKPDPSAKTVPVEGAQEWIAMKSHFFVAAAYTPEGEGWMENAGFEPAVEHAAGPGGAVVSAVSAKVLCKDLPASRRSAFYFGPRKQSALWDRGMRDAMDFGWCRWICYPIVWLLNALEGVFGNYGVAIILLTLIIRLVFWPLTHKSTLSMRRMQEIQPLLKEVQERCKGNPQKLQMETMAIYREHKVNPFASCLPMLVQIPFFIALFYVLRSSVELRFAPFLWIDDLSAPEHLLPDVFPFGGLNILPILMAVTMFLQTKLSPSAGGAQAAQQQKMMMFMMPAMMLVMFYNFASALSLYWTMSQLMSIAQSLYIRKKYKPQTPASQAVIDAPVTRQRRRHG